MAWDGLVIDDQKISFEFREHVDARFRYEDGLAYCHRCLTRLAHALW